MVWREAKTREMEPLGASTVASNHRTVGTFVWTLAQAVFRHFLRSSLPALPRFPFSSHFVDYAAAHTSSGFTFELAAC